MARYLYSELASLVSARRNCAQPSSHEFTTTEGIKSHCAICGQIDSHVNHQMINPDWFDKHTESIERLVKQHMPSGSGFDSGTILDLDASHGDKLVFQTGFHHMDEWGGYSGWTDHTVTVTPSLQFKYHIRISGRNQGEIKDLIHDAFDVALGTDVTYDLFVERYPEFAITSKWEDKDGSASQCYMAWYVNGERFWNDYQSARDRAAQLMEAKRQSR